MIPNHLNRLTNCNLLISVGRAVTISSSQRTSLLGSSSTTVLEQGNNGLHVNVIGANLIADHEERIAPADKLPDVLGLLPEVVGPTLISA